MWHGLTTTDAAICVSKLNQVARPSCFNPVKLHGCATPASEIWVVPRLAVLRESATEEAGSERAAKTPLRELTCER